MPAIGFKHSEESKRKIGEANKTRGQSAASRRKISETLRGHPVSEETRRKLREKATGKKHSAESRQKMSEKQRGENNPNFGKPLSEEQMALLRKANLGRKPSAETLLKRGAALKGHPTSDETKRKISKAVKGKHCGPDHWSWRGGVSFEPYCVKFNDEFKERVREFFGRKCAECGVPENGVRLSVHHVNYHKDACCTEGVAPLFVPLCPGCHSRTHGNREFWEARFTSLIVEQYGGQCYLPKQ